MQIGFETTAAVPKRLRAVEEQPVQQAMRGERKVTQAPSTDQKKVRRQMQRKTAANFSAGTCRMCEGNLIPMGRKSDSEPSTMRAQCADCGTKHELQGAEVKKVSALAYEAFQNLPAEEKERLEFLADLQMEAWYPPNYEKGNCPHCGAGKSKQNFEGTGASNGHNGIYAKCDKCSKSYMVDKDKGIIPPDSDANMSLHQRRQKYPEQYADTPEYAERGRREKEKDKDFGFAASRRAVLISLAGATWVPIIDTTPYLSAPSMSAIARRAQSVLDTEEIL